MALHWNGKDVHGMEKLGKGTELIHRALERRGVEVHGRGMA